MWPSLGTHMFCKTKKTKKWVKEGVGVRSMGEEREKKKIKKREKMRKEREKKSWKLSGNFLANFGVRIRWFWCHQKGFGFSFQMSIISLHVLSVGRRYEATKISIFQTLNPWFGETVRNLEELSRHWIQDINDLQKDWSKNFSVTVNCGQCQSTTVNQWALFTSGKILYSGSSWCFK